MIKYINRAVRFSLAILFSSLYFVACNNETIAPVPVHELSATDLTLDKIGTSQTVYIRNTGRGVLEWSLTTDEKYITADIRNGVIGGGDSVGVNLIGNINAVEEGVIYSSLVTFHFPQTFDQSVNVRVVNMTEKKWRLTESIADAEYDRKHDVIIAVTKQSGKLLIIDPAQKKINEINLDLPGVCVSVSPDGKRAVVGHKAAVSYVNLETQVVEKVYGLSQEVFDIVLSGSGWAYVFPGKTQWTNLLRINLSTGEQKSDLYSLYSDSRGKLHPSGQFLYSIETRSFPTDLGKYSIDENGQSAHLYDSPYHGDYPMGTNLWFSDDGLTIFTGMGNLFTSNLAEETDIRYKGKLSLGSTTMLYTLDHSSNAKRVYGVPGWRNYDDTIVPTGELLSFDFSNTLIDSKVLEKFLLADADGNPVLSDGLGYFVFFNASGTQAHILQKADHQSEIWALLSINVD